MFLTLSTHLALCLWAGHTLAVTNIASWQGPRGAQIQSKIVLEGGLISTGTFANNEWTAAAIMPHPYGVYYQIDLTKPFNPRSDNTSNYLKYVLNETQDTSRPTYVDGGMFYNDYQFFTFGGLADQQPVPQGETNVLLGKVFPQDPSNQIFSQGISPDQQTGVVSDNICSGAYASSPDQGLGFYFGGMVSANRSTLLLNSGDTDAEHPTATSNTLIKAEWTKADTATFSYVNWPASVTPRAESGLVWLPYGKQGVLIAIGGVEVPGDLYLTTPPREVPTDGPFMTEIIVYDIANDTWSVQETLETNNKPTQLASFCTAVVPTQDNKSYEIFVYGGYDGTYNSSDPNVKDEVWVLSVPAFQWTKVKDAESSDSHGRQGNMCFAPNPTTLISVGGTDVLGGSLKSDTIVDILNLTDLTWGGAFDPSSNAPFTVPGAIIQQLGWPSDGKGPGTSAQVTGLNGTLNELFSDPYPYEVKTYYPYTNGSSSTNNSINGGNNNSNNHPNHWKVPVIATLCSVIPLAIIAVIVFFCVRKHRKNKQGVQQTQQSRGKVFSWLGKSSQPIDPVPEKSQTSDNTNDTLVENHPDYFRQHGYKNMNGEIYEAPSAVHSPGYSEAYEIMDQSQADGLSSHNQMSPAMPATMSERSGNASRFSESFPSPTRAARNAGPVPVTYELPHSTSDERLPQTREVQRVPVGEGRPSLSDRASSPYTERRPDHQRNVSNVSDDMQSLPSPGSDVGDQKSPTTLNITPDTPTSPPLFPRKSVAPKLEHLKE